MIGARLVVRVSGIGVDGYDRRIVGKQVLAAKRFHEPLLDFMFRGSTVAGAPADFLKGCGHDRIHAVAGGKVSLDLFFAPGRFELRDQVGGADHVLPQSAQQLDGAAIDQRDSEDDVVGRILHGDVAVRCEHRLQGVEQLLPSGILALAAGQGIEMAGFDFVDQLYRFALRRNQVKPAARDHQPCWQTEHAIGDGIAMMVVVEQPRVDVAFAQRRLNGSEVHGQTSIVNNGRDLGESGMRRLVL